MYVRNGVTGEQDFKTKDALKAAVKMNDHYLKTEQLDKIVPIEVFSPGPYPAPKEGKAYIEGPHYPQPHKWYASVEVRDGKVVKVIS